MQTGTGVEEGDNPSVTDNSGDNNKKSFFTGIAEKANYILVANGVILASVLPSLWKFPETQSDLGNSISFLNYTYLANNPPSLNTWSFLSILLLSIVFLTGVSAGACLGVINSGIRIPHHNPGYELKEYEDRSKAAIRWYGCAIVSFGLSLVLVFMYISETTIHGFGGIAGIIVFSIFVYLITIRNVFSRFGVHFSLAEFFTWLGRNIHKTENLLLIVLLGLASIALFQSIYFHFFWLWIISVGLFIFGIFLINKNSTLLRDS
jgi:hypothetical protein